MDNQRTNAYTCRRGEGQSVYALQGKVDASIQVAYIFAVASLVICKLHA